MENVASSRLRILILTGLLAAFLWSFPAKQIALAQSNQMFTGHKKSLDNPESGHEAVTDEYKLPEIVVRQDTPVTSSSDLTFRQKDFICFPMQTPSDLLRVMPGIHISQHTGGAKAHHIFLRGFDCEHGQDFAGFIDGIPLNQVSQIHGEGYLDLHFLIPESVGRINIIKGPYDAEYGNYAVSGAMNLLTKNRMDVNSIKAEYGSFHYTRGLLQLNLQDKHLFLWKPTEQTASQSREEVSEFVFSTPIPSVSDRTTC